MLALFIDGAGRTREMSIAYDHMTFRFPKPTPVSVAYCEEEPCLPTAIDAQIATFDRLGQLPDSRIVYGLHEARLSLWDMNITVADEAKQQVPFDIAEYKLQEWLYHAYSQPTRCLYHSTERDGATWLTKHRFMGIGRPR